VNKRALDDCLTRRMFVVPAFEIHGGVAGLYDYGPAGCALKENLLALWRQHFVLEDSLLQIECTTLTPYNVLKASGHVDKFEDLMVKDVKTGDCYRADKLLEDFIDNLLEKDKEMTSTRRDELRRIAAQAGAFTKDQIKQVFADLGIKAPATGNDLTDPFQFNLMFQTSIGPTGAQVGFLRPETAQGMFVNFRRLYDFNNQRMPMGVAQIGSAYRNEIAPRGGLLRVREFTMAEIEYFVHPEQKDHTKWASVKDLRLTLFPGENQIGDGKTISPTLDEAVTKGIVNNQTLAYFMARTALFVQKAGIKPAGMRFRQHLKTEMAHYATDCWDLEILMSSGWVECVGIADRSAFDLKVHTKATKVDLVAREVYPEPREETVLSTTINRQLIGKTFKQDNVAVSEALAALAEDVEKAMAFQAQLSANGSAELAIGSGATAKNVTLTKDMITFATALQRVVEKKYVPNVIEPSFGIGRIITGILEHTFYVREDDEQRAVLAFSPVVAPSKAVVLTLDGRIPRTHAQAIASSLTAAGLSATVDDSNASVGKRYSRADEIGIPFAITFDHQSQADGAVTLRERDTCAQVRLPIAKVAETMRALVNESLRWADVVAKYGLVAPAAEGEAAPEAAPVVVEGKERNYGRFSRPSMAL
jgi:glycyl-tRNA synthetase